MKKIKTAQTIPTAPGSAARAADPLPEQDVFAKQEDMFTGGAGG